MPTLYILCGLPYSGKSLFSKEIEKTTSIKRISFDDEYEKLKILNKSITNKKAHNEIDKKIIKNLKDGNSVVYDSLNHSINHRNRLKKIAEKIGVDFKVVYLKISEDEIYKRRIQSLADNSHLNALSKKDISNAIKQFEIPDDCIIVSTEENKRDFLESLKIINL